MSNEADRTPHGPERNAVRTDKRRTDEGQSCERLPFFIRRDGVWFYRDTPVKRKALTCLFSSALTRDADGVFWLMTPTERGIIEVEDTPFVAVAMNWRGSGRNQTLLFRTNVDQIIELGPEHALRIDWQKHRDTCERVSIPVITVRDGEGKFPIEARLSRPVWYELTALAERGFWRGQPCAGVWSHGIFFPLSCDSSCRDTEC